MGLKTTILHYKFGRFGGAEIYTLQAAHALAAAGCKINAISTALIKGRNEVDGIAHRSLLPRSKLRRILQVRLQKYFGYENVILKRVLRQEAQDSDFILVGHFNYLRPVVEYAQKVQKKVWLIVYGIDIWRDWTPTEKIALQACDRIIAISTYTADMVRRRMPRQTTRIVVLHPMVDTEYFTPNADPPPATPRVILTVGRLDASEAYKGHDLIIQALPELNKKLKVPLEYQIIGDGGDRQRLEKLTYDCGVGDQVRFLGHLTGNSFIQAYRRCHVFAMPSYVTRRSDGSWTGEGFGIVYLEAAACAKPVLACDEGGQTDAVQHAKTGFLVKPEIKSIIDGLLRLLQDLNLANVMGKAGRRFALDNFTKKHFERKWARLLQ